MAKSESKSESSVSYRLVNGGSRRMVCGIELAPGVVVEVPASKLAERLESRHGWTVGEFLDGCDYVERVK